MTPEKEGVERCQAPDCVSKWEDTAHYYIVTGGDRKCYCAACFIKREHEFIRKRQQDDEAKKKGKP